MSAEGKNGGEKPVDRSKLLKLEDGEVDKDEETELQRSTVKKGQKPSLTVASGDTNESFWRAAA